MIKELLEVKGLTRRFGKKTAVAGIDFTLSEGEFVGLLGPNGAGKTTTIRMLTGLYRPTSGIIRYYGKDFLENQKEIKGYIGVVHQYSNLDRDLTAYENLNLHCILHGIPSSLRKQKIEEALEFSGLTEYRNRQVKTFSGGMKRRLVIVRALLHDPKILFLDEPTVGLDPQIRRSLWDLIVRINQLKKMSILLTSHYIEEAERLCERVMIINEGRIIADDSPEALKKDLGRYVLEVFHEEGIEERIFNSKEDALEVLRTCEETCKVREVTLEDVFLNLTGRRIDV
ncbi:MAG: ABC transporter ATP-binding protein [Nitrospirae bacterium]|nr:MAG: ABC transporter ATP-binding protein [Nitrospirota bacterium]